MAAMRSCLVLAAVALLAPSCDAQTSYPSSSTSQKSGVFASMCNAANKMLPGICAGGTDPSASLAEDGCKTNPSSCCEDSTCATAVGMGCWAKRGDTQCVGNKLFPFPSMGKCQCKSGYCGTDGTCAVSVSSGADTSFRQFGNSFGRLYEERDEKIPPEDHTVAFLGYGAAFFGTATLGVVLGGRLRTRLQSGSSQAAEQELELLESEDREDQIE
eukprot:gb/GFBE01061960.1/.p1 GENE.gb/GFBE01061960.1/~~gb/GFBE01061960.1/.p1  ORF type:complete len:215 (+),score=43.20 gb/GFBE01061960.1/:1-645(+)